jgi:hypothetical protein
MARIKDVVSLKSFGIQLCPSSILSIAHNSVPRIISFLSSEEVIQLVTGIGNLC